MERKPPNLEDRRPPCGRRYRGPQSCSPAHHARICSPKRLTDPRRAQRYSCRINTNPTHHGSLWKARYRDNTAVQLGAPAPEICTGAPRIGSSSSSRLAQLGGALDGSGAVRRGRRRRAYSGGGNCRWDARGGLEGLRGIRIGVLLRLAVMNSVQRRRVLPGAICWSMAGSCLVAGTLRASMPAARPRYACYHSPAPGQRASFEASERRLRQRGAVIRRGARHLI